METAVQKCEHPRVKRVLLPSFYLAPVEYYTVLFHAHSAQIEVHDHYQKQSYRNRCVIAGANGPMTLSIPVEKAKSDIAPMRETRISNHGDWQHLHWNAIRSAYNSTPFFSYYEDDFRPFYEEKIPFLHDFNERLRQLVCRLIGMETPVSYTSRYIEQTKESEQPGRSDQTGKHVIDLREAIHPKRPPYITTPPYYQVFSEKLGFLPNLSIIDLLFNLGNESRLYLARISDPHHFSLFL